ncbi:13342_t:CDS:2 [Dentiscutata heterogama]|uniref:13342_t:CDS:1 n=1 Tax=Dentiscutata heterogama TaxID=1316150 RepID=A0ACA9K0T3_9GLOM|nr:13342_t:CDS:2 [Dentiscutata heterogama]
MEDLNDNFVFNNFMSNNSVSNNSMSNNSVSNNFISNNLTNSDNSVSNTCSSNSLYCTKDHWNMILNNNNKAWKCCHCQEKIYKFNTNRTYLKQHTTSCSYSPICESRNNKSRLIKPIMKDKMDNSIIDLVVGTGILFNIFDNSLFHNMVKKLYSVADSYKISHLTTISQHLSGNIFSKRLEFIKNILIKTSGQISLMCDRWHLTVHRCHYTVVTGSWISDDWQQNCSNSISNAIKVILEISQHLKKININNMTYLIIKKFEKYWNKIINHIIITHILDPRYKFEYLKATLIEVREYSDKDADQFIDNIRQKIILYRRKYINIQSPSTINSINESPPTTNIINELLPTTQYKLELYEKDPIEEENNGVLIWNSLSKKIPILNRIAHDYLSIQPSNITSKRAFLRAGFTITNDRANLSEKTVASTILMHSWLLESQNEFSPLNALPKS